MNDFYGYIRVSTKRQGEGVSPEEQRALISAYAEKRNLVISEWFEEKVTAAKTGRPEFMKMLAGLRTGKAKGVIIHKIDRSARNLRDWVDIGDLVDAGVEILFANESLDLRSRGGRLAADIQAVVAADFIRNNREEVRKGQLGRLKQGLYPFTAPLGYLNTGKGKLKEIDPVRAPLVRKAFELYDTGRFGHHSLCFELERLGLRKPSGKPLCVNAVANVLSNPFYAGIIRIRKTGATFDGAHTPLISMALYKRVRARALGRISTRRRRHAFLLSNMFRCSLCYRALIGEKQKGHVYYRCHTKSCATAGFREEELEKAVLETFPPSCLLTSSLIAKLSNALDTEMASGGTLENERRTKCRLQLDAVRARHARLVDALVDGALDKSSFDQRKAQLFEEQRLLEESLKADEPDSARVKQFILGFIELAGMAQQSYKIANTDSKRELVLKLTSNRTVARKEVSVEPYFPIARHDNHWGSPECAHYRGTNRTLQAAARTLIEWAKKELKTKTDNAGSDPTRCLRSATRGPSAGTRMLSNRRL